MNIFEDIKNGVLPDNNVIFYLYENRFIDEKNKEEIQKYISILNNSFETASTEEKILLNRVLFILEMLIDEKDALKNFLYKALRLNLHDVDDEYKLFFQQFFETKVKQDIMFELLKQRIPELINLNKEELRSFFNWNLHLIWNWKEYHNHEKFRSFYDNLKKLILDLRDKNRIDEMMYVEFFTYHIMGNGFHTIDEWREFNENVTKQTIKAYNQFIPSLSKPKNTKKSKRKIAFIKDRIVFNSPYQVEYSLFKNLMQNEEFTKNYELIVYTFNQFEKSNDDEKLIADLENIGIKVRRVVDYFQKDGYYNNHLDKALTLRENLINDEIDIMIAGGVFPILNFLYVTRTAPLQIYYSHGNCAFDVPNIDKRVSHFNQECQEFEWNIINVPMDEKFLVGSEGEKIVGNIIKEDYKKQFGEDVVILGTIGRLIKIDSNEYIKTISEIMKQNPNTIYLACGTGNEETIKEKIKKYNVDEKRFIFTGHVKPHVYGWVIDVWCETFPLRQGHSRNEFEAKGGAIVGYKKYYTQNAIIDIENLSQELNIPTPLSNNLEEFVVITNNLIKDKNLRKKTGLLYKQLREFYSQFDFNQVKKVLDCK